MKKLMIAMAVVATALVSQAASANWNFSNNATIYDGTGKSTALGAGYVVYIFDADKNSAESVFNQWFGGTTALTGSIADTTTAAGGQFSISDVTYGEQSTTGTAKYYNYFFAIVDSDAKIFISDTKNIKANKSTTAKDVLISDVDSNSAPLTSFDQGQWTNPEPTPEPTSAMLMLLGVAGLALKRKQK